jgi:hypothetical protein
MAKKKAARKIQGQNFDRSYHLPAESRQLLVTVRGYPLTEAKFRVLVSRNPGASSVSTFCLAGAVAAAIPIVVSMVDGQQVQRGGPLVIGVLVIVAIVAQFVGHYFPSERTKLVKMIRAHFTEPLPGGDA